MNKTGRVGVEEDMRTMGVILMMLGAGIAMGSPLPEKAELLATNTVVAEYEGTHYQPCRHMTALCPDRCDHATVLAHFKVEKNLYYEKKGEYGDEELRPGQRTYVDVMHEVPGQDKEVVRFISQLKPGQKVCVTINHYYVQQGQSQFPVRPVVKIERTIF